MIGINTPQSHLYSFWVLICFVDFVQYIFFFGDFVFFWRTVIPINGVVNSLIVWSWLLFGKSSYRLPSFSSSLTTSAVSESELPSLHDFHTFFFSITHLCTHCQIFKIKTHYLKMNKNHWTSSSTIFHVHFCCASYFYCLLSVFNPHASNWNRQTGIAKFCTEVQYLSFNSLELKTL